jgi:hypothetical protein
MKYLKQLDLLVVLGILAALPTFYAVARWIAAIGILINQGIVASFLGFILLAAMLLITIGPIFICLYGIYRHWRWAIGLSAGVFPVLWLIECYISSYAQPSGLAHTIELILSLAIALGLTYAFITRFRATKPATS